MEHIEFWIVITLFLAVIVVQYIIHKQEREDLYNRIMARDLPEYEARNSSKPKSVPNGIKKNIAEAYKKRNTPEE